MTGESEQPHCRGTRPACPIVYVVVEPSRQPDDGPTSDLFRPRDARLWKLRRRAMGDSVRTQRRRHDRDGGHPRATLRCPVRWVLTSTGSSRCRGVSCRRSRSSNSTRRSTRPTRLPTMVRDRAHPVRKARGPSRLRRAARNRHDGVHVIGALVPAAIVRQAGGRDGFADPHRPHARMAGRTSSGRSRWRFSPVSLRSPSLGEALPQGEPATKVDASGLDAFDSPRFPPSPKSVST